MQTEIPDDVMPRQRGLTNEQMAIRQLAAVVFDIAGYTNMQDTTYQRICKDIFNVQALIDKEENGRTDGS